MTTDNLQLEFLRRAPRHGLSSDLGEMAEALELFHEIPLALHAPPIGVIFYGGFRSRGFFTKFRIFDDREARVTRICTDRCNVAFVVTSHT